MRGAVGQVDARPRRGAVAHLVTLQFQPLLLLDLDQLVAVEDQVELVERGTGQRAP
ncbi:hypothetical protein [Streptomyces sp. NPDC007905]|uniref:hypothetical protein n=1 Tax=Streptomyces sp. NPDC007905 TaxID=3364788 RepID=UPI0036E85970